MKNSRTHLCHGAQEKERSREHLGDRIGCIFFRKVEGMWSFTYLYIYSYAIFYIQAEQAIDISKYKKFIALLKNNKCAINSKYQICFLQ